MSCVVLFPVRLLGGILIDVVMEESVEAEMELPEHPVERGAKVSDHAFRKPTILKMSCLSRDVMSTWQVLYGLMKEAEPFDVQTGFDLFESMVIQKLEPRRDKETSIVLSFDCTMKEVIIVSSAETQGGQGGQSAGKGEGDGKGNKAGDKSNDGRAAAKTSRGQVQPRAVEGSVGDRLLAGYQAI